VDPVAAGVTSIDYDHTEYLGDTLEKIASEKAGIYKSGRPAVVGETDPALRAVLARDARRAGATPVRVVADECSIENVRVNAGGTTFTLDALGDRRQMTTPLTGRHQAENAAFTIVLLAAAGAPYACTVDDAARAMPSVRVAGRFQREGRFIFDVAHNAEGSLVLADTLALVQPTAPVVALFSVLSDKDWRSMLRSLAPRVSHFIATIAPTAPAGRVWSLDDVKQFADSAALSLETVADFDEALTRASTLGETTLVTGSFHTVGDAMARLQRSPLSR
jgi:dihydrofolate synthase/folylpolyglutamate synthase